MAKSDSSYPKRHHASRITRHASCRGFTLVELLVVLFIMLLLVGVAAPALSQMVKSSRVQSAAKTAMAALFQARSEAQRFRACVVAMFGDVRERLPVAPPSGVLPEKNRIELWRVKMDVGYDFSYGASSPPFGSAAYGYPDWYPYGGSLADKDRPLTESASSFPEGVRILTGALNRYTWDAAKNRYALDFNFGSFNPASPEGEVKRHVIAFSRNGGMPGWYEGLYAYFHCLVFDEASGEHLAIWCGEWRASSKPRILPHSLDILGTRSGTVTNVTDYRQIPQKIDQ